MALGSLDGASLGAAIRLARVAYLCGCIDTCVKGVYAVPDISRDEVAHLARLSRLALSEAELDEFAGQLDSILHHVKAVAEVAADDVPPTANPSAITNVTRPDVIVPGLTPQQALSGAPNAEEDRFAVPQILGESE